MTADDGLAKQIADLEARVAALGALMRSLLATLMLRGVMTRADIAPLMEQAAAMLPSDLKDAGADAEFKAITHDVAGSLSRAAGPIEQHDHDH